MQSPSRSKKELECGVEIKSDESGVKHCGSDGSSFIIKSLN